VNDRYGRDLQAGLEFQDQAMVMFSAMGLHLQFYASIEAQVKTGESMQGIEVKLDRRFRETGNLYIETCERSSPSSEWHAAGITRDDNAWALAIGDPSKIYVLGVKQLRRIASRYREVHTETSRGFLMPLRDAEICSLFTLPRDPCPAAKI
jgi:hypothetical protein